MYLLVLSLAVVVQGAKESSKSADGGTNITPFQSLGNLRPLMPKIEEEENAYGQFMHADNIEPRMLNVVPVDFGAEGSIPLVPQMSRVDGPMLPLKSMNIVSAGSLPAMSTGSINVGKGESFPVFSEGIPQMSSSNSFGAVSQRISDMTSVNALAVLPQRITKIPSDNNLSLLPSEQLTLNSVGNFQMGGHGNSYHNQGPLTIVVNNHDSGPRPAVYEPRQLSIVPESKQKRKIIGYKTVLETRKVPVVTMRKQPVVRMRQVVEKVPVVRMVNHLVKLPSKY